MNEKALKERAEIRSTNVACATRFRIKDHIVFDFFFRDFRIDLVSRHVCWFVNQPMIMLMAIRTKPFNWRVEIIILIVK